MKKIMNIIVIILIIAIVVVACILLGKFINKIRHEKLDTSYMWNVRYQNMKILDGSNDGKTKESKDGIELEVTLKEPKEFYEATFEIENYGSLDAYISKINKNITSTDNILTCKITYLDGKEIKKGDKIKSNSKQTIKIRIDYPEQKEKIYKELKLNVQFSLQFKASYK